jgi:hypothetical protein
MIITYIIMCTNCGNNVYPFYFGGDFCTICISLPPKQRLGIRNFYDLKNNSCFWCGSVTNCDCILRTDEQLNHIYGLHIARKYNEIRVYKSKNKPPKCYDCNKLIIENCDCKFCSWEELVHRRKLRGDPEALSIYILSPKCKRCYSALKNNQCDQCLKIIIEIFKVSNKYNLGWNMDYLHKKFFPPLR